TFLHEVPRGAKEVTLANYYEENQDIVISLNEALSPNQNAQKYFQRYQKLKNSVKIVKEQLEKAKYELLYLQSVEDQLTLASPKDIDVIREELLAEKYVKDKQKSKKSKPVKSKPETFYSSKGVTILVGKNNLQNDQLTLKTASKTDIWLHAKDIPGSHVIIKESNPDNDTLLEAAQLAAYYSKYRLSSQVPVDYVHVKHVKKPNGSKPGYVIYENQQTLFVTPEKEIIENALLNGGQL
ncbi:MAG: NFACT family protein, partial [Vagococcus sp.]